LCRLYESGVVCMCTLEHWPMRMIGPMVLLAPTPSALRVMLKICEDFAKKFSVIFNASKSVCLQVQVTSMEKN